jgi:SAM-dependent methyltransferase
MPYILQAHGSLDPWHRDQKRRAKDLYHAVIEDPIIRGAAAMLCTSHREEMSIRDLGYSVPTWVIPIGVDAALLRTPGSPDLETAGIDPTGRVVAFLGRISEKKGVPLLVESFRKVASTLSDAHLVIAGPDDEGIARALRSTIAASDLAGRVSFVGFLRAAEKRALLQRSDVFVLPSADESFGIAVAEAMAVGCPVIVSPDVAIQDVVQGSGAGLVVERQASAIANAIATILNEPARAGAMGAAGRQAVDDGLSWPTVAAQMESMYAAVMRAEQRAVPESKRSERRSALTGGPTGPVFRCPCCHGTLALDESDSVSCATCGWSGTVVEGIPILLQQPRLATHDELDHHSTHGNKSAQAAHFGQADEEAFEIARPHGAPRLYRYLLAFKFRRAVGPIRPHLAGATALSVCGGSGMDAEFLARAGASVTSSDLSFGAARRARARSERYEAGFSSVVADAEQLPYADRSIDLVAVHDGLHHLDDPFAGLAEMARVARRWVVVSEPARASVTRLAIRLGVALETEEAGNRVARMEPSEVGAFLRDRGFRVLRAERYAMYYPHHPGVVFRLLSGRVVFPIVRTGWRLTNAMFGRFGNKMVVVAERAQDGGAARLSVREPPPV